MRAVLLVFRNAAQHAAAGVAPGAQLTPAPVRVVMIV